MKDAKKKIIISSTLLLATAILFVAMQNCSANPNKGIDLGDGNNNTSSGNVTFGIYFSPYQGLGSTVINVMDSTGKLVQSCTPTASGCVVSATKGSSLNLTAQVDSNANYTFQSWGGGACSGSTYCAVTVASGIMVVANFTSKGSGVTTTTNSSGTTNQTTTTRPGSSTTVPGSTSTTVPNSNLVTFTGNNQRSLTVNVKDTINFAWDASAVPNFQSISGSVFVDSADTCGISTDASNPTNWSVTTQKGTTSGAIPYCEGGHTYTLVVTARDLAGNRFTSQVVVRVNAYPNTSLGAPLVTDFTASADCRTITITGTNIPPTPADISIHPLTDSGGTWANIDSSDTGQFLATPSSSTSTRIVFTIPDSWTNAANVFRTTGLRFTVSNISAPAPNWNTTNLHTCTPQ